MRDEYLRGLVWKIGPDNAPWVAYTHDGGNTYHPTHADAIDAVCARLKDHVVSTKKTPTNA